MYFTYRIFRKWAKSEKLTDKVLHRAVEEMNEGLFDANLGGGLYKKRVSKEGRGKSGGYRTIFAFKRKDKAFFIYGFAKSDQDNLTDNEQEKFKLLGKSLLGVTDRKLISLMDEGILFEVLYDKEK